MLLAMAIRPGFSSRGGQRETASTTYHMISKSPTLSPLIGYDCSFHAGPSRSAPDPTGHLSTMTLSWRPGPVSGCTFVWIARHWLVAVSVTHGYSYTNSFHTSSWLRHFLLETALVFRHQIMFHVCTANEPC